MEKETLNVYSTRYQASLCTIFFKSQQNLHGRLSARLVRQFSSMNIDFCDLTKFAIVRVEHFLFKYTRDRLKSAPYLRLKNIQGTTIGNICKKINFF